MEEYEERLKAGLCEGIKNPVRKTTEGDKGQ